MELFSFTKLQYSTTEKEELTAPYRDMSEVK